MQLGRIIIRLGFVDFRVRHHHSLFCRTLLAMSEGGFLTTIHNMIAVAADRAYLFEHLVSLPVSYFQENLEREGVFDLRYPGVLTM